MRPNPRKVMEVKEWPTPKNKTELEAFLTGVKSVPGFQTKILIK